MLSQASTGEQARSLGEAPAAAGPLLSLAQEVIARLEGLKESLEMDELDPSARRYARKPASGAARALVALGYVARCFPGQFRRADVNLRPEYLLSLVDRKHAVDLLDSTLFPLADLLRDTKTDVDEEVVDLLSAGYALMAVLPGTASPEDPALAAALSILSDYKQRVSAERAHRSQEQIRQEKRPGSKGTPDPGP